MALLGLAMPAGASGDPATFRFHASALADIGADGKAHVATLEPLVGFSQIVDWDAMVKLIDKRLRDRIESWEFVPALRDGVAVPSRTHVQLRLEAVQESADSIAIRVLSASTGPSVATRANFGRLFEALAADSEGYVTLRVRYGPDGHVREVSTRSSGVFVKNHFEGMAGVQLRRTALRVVREWTIEPELIGGQPRGGEGLLPIQFCNSEDCSRTPIPDAGHGTEAPNVFASIDPAVKLRSAVAGTAL